MNTVQYLVNKLSELGITDFFGVPGDYNFNILKEIENNPKTKWIGCTNELNAGYAADGYARERGYGAVVTTYGVGELSAMNAIAGCYAETVPVIHIVGIPTSKCLEDKSLVHHSLNTANPEAYLNAFKNITLDAVILNRDNSKIEIDRLLHLFVKEKKPVYIAIPIDVTDMEISDRVVDYDWISDQNTLDNVVEKALQKINEAKNPIILGDVLIKRFDAKIEYKEFVEKSGFPVTNFVMGCDLISTNYDKYIGTYFGKYKNFEAKKLLEDTDCLIAVGTVYSDFNAFGFNLPYEINSHIAIYGTHTFIDGIKYENVKMSDVLEKLSEKIEHRDISVTKADIGYEPSAFTEEKLNSAYIYPRLQEFLNENDIVIGETGLAQYGLSRLKLPENVNIHTQALWSSIGWATPAAFGANIANPNSRIVLVTGEGAHQISMPEIGNMLKHKLKPIIIILNNQGYGIEKLLSDSDADYNNVVKISYAKFARTFDGEIWSTKVETQDDFDKALKVTQIMNKLCYIEACLDKNDVPELAHLVNSEMKTKAKKIEKTIPETYCATDKKEVKAYEKQETPVVKEDLPEEKKEDAIITEKSDEGYNYGTTVHERLKFEE